MIYHRWRCVPTGVAAEQLPILRAPSPLTANRRSTRLPDIDRPRIDVTRKHLPLPRLLPNLSARLIKRLIAHKISATPIGRIIAGGIVSRGKKSRRLRAAGQNFSSDFSHDLVRKSRNGRSKAGHRKPISSNNESRFIKFLREGSREKEADVHREESRNRNKLFA